MTSVFGTGKRSYVDPTHDLYLQPNEMLANQNVLSGRPVDLLQKVLKSHPAVPALPLYPLALVRDARLAGLRKSRAEMLISDSPMERLWLHDSRLDAVEKYVANWHREVDDDRAQFELAWVVHELERRVHFFQSVAQILRTRERGAVKARRMQQALFQQIRALSLQQHIKLSDKTVRLIKAGFARHASFLAWRLDNLYLQSDTRSIVKVKHGGHHLEHVAGDILWQLRALATKQHHDWRLNNQLAESSTHSFVHVKHGGHMPETVWADIGWHERHEATRAHAAWRHDNLYTTLPNGGIVHVHHMPGRFLERVSAQVEWPKSEAHRRGTGRWHATNREVVTANLGIVHEGGLGAMPEAAAAAIWKPKLRDRVRQVLEDQGSHQLLKLPNGSFIHAEKGHVRGQSPELLTAQINKPRQEKVTEGHAAFHNNHLMAPTPNHGIAPLKGHGMSFEHVAAEAMQRPKHAVTAAFQLWRATHTFATNASHEMTPTKLRGLSFAAVTGAVAERLHDRITRHFLEHRLRDRYTRTASGGLRRLPHTGKSLEAVAAEVAPPDEGTAGQPVPAAKGGHELASSKLVTGHDEQRHHRHGLTLIQKSLAAHDRTVSLLEGHVVRSQSPVGAVNPGTLPAIALVAPKSAKRS